MIDLVNNPNSDNSVVAQTLEWILKADGDVYAKEIKKKFVALQERYPEIKFLLLPWGSYKLENERPGDFIEIKENGTEYKNAQGFLQQNGLLVWHKAKGFNGNYKFNVPEDHASVEGHQRIANIVTNHLKQLENE
jgi:hypothetical protein